MKSGNRVEMLPFYRRKNPFSRDFKKVLTALPAYHLFTLHKSRDQRNILTANALLSLVY